MIDDVAERSAPTLGLLSVFDPVGDRPCNEFEIQAFLWSELRRAGFRVRGEYVFWDDNGTMRRADLAVFVEGYHMPFAIEVKADNKAASRLQVARYKCIQSPFRGVVVVSGMAHAVHFLEVMCGYDRAALADEMRTDGVGIRFLAVRSRANRTARSLSANARDHQRRGGDDD